MLLLKHGSPKQRQEVSPVIAVSHFDLSTGVCVDTYIGKHALLSSEWYGCFVNVSQRMLQSPNTNTRFLCRPIYL